MENRASKSATARTVLRHTMSYAPSRPADPHHDAYFRDNPAAKYHALQPFYVGQETLASCSVASAACVMNAILAHAGKAPISQQELLGTNSSGDWARAVNGPQATGVSLMRLATFLHQAFAARQFPGVAIDVAHVLECDKSTADHLEAALVRGEANPYNHFMIINFQQSAYLEDGAKEGHLSVIGAFDEARSEALVLDVDSQHFGPYWVPFAHLLRGLSSRRPHLGMPRGYLSVHVFADGF